jgi:asparagine synthase (glutamine-hydrolysing)
MCGINGILGINDSEKAALLVSRMNNALAHRGPNDEGVFTDTGVGLGHRRLSIIDLSKNGHQPMTTIDGRYTIVYNGELYNYKALKMDMQRSAAGSTDAPYPFRTQTDTEVILAAYLRWGVKCLGYFNGMFSFAIWDNKERELFIARDRLGIKPLYYWHNDSVFAFASEMRALLETGLMPRRVSAASLNDYVSFQTVHAPHTIMEDILMLLPGHYLLLKSGNISASVQPVKYWSANSFGGNSETKPYKEICSNVKELLASAVEMRLVSDVPFGAFLSGGIDSGIVVALMAQIMNRKVKTFTVSFGETGFDETPYSGLVAKKYGTDHQNIILTAESCLEKLPAALAAMDHPGGDGINSYIVSQAAREQGVTMALSGVGGDELFAGYPLFKRLYRLQKMQGLQPLAKPLLTTPAILLNMLMPSPASAKFRELCRLPGWTLDSTYPLMRQVYSYKEAAKLLNSNAGFTRSAEFSSQQGLLSRISTAELNHYLADVLLRDTDQFSMAHALEVRVPFLDHRLVEYVLGLGDDAKYPHTPKKLLVDAAGALLPPELLNRGKTGFTLPWNKWMMNELLTFCETNINNLAGRNGFNRDKILNLWNSFKRGNASTPWYKLWHLVALENWMERNNAEC